MIASVEQIRIMIGVCREDNPRDVDEAYGAGTYERLYPTEEACEGCNDFPALSNSTFCSNCLTIMDADSRYEDPARSHGRC